MVLELNKKLRITVHNILTKDDSMSMVGWSGNLFRPFLKFRERVPDPLSLIRIIVAKRNVLD